MITDLPFWSNYLLNKDHRNLFSPLHFIGKEISFLLMSDLSGNYLKKKTKKNTKTTTLTTVHLKYGPDKHIFTCMFVLCAAY